MRAFSGYPKESLLFLQQLASHNSKDWFNDNKAHYEQLIRGPSLAFIETMEPHLHAISPRFLASAKKSGGSLMRVYRDTRFSKDKTPYKTNIGIQFRHEVGKDVHAPGFYVHIEPANCFLGVGIWHPDTQTLSKIRDFILGNPASWKAARDEKAFAKAFSLAGDSLKRPPRGYPADHAFIDDLKRKDFIVCKNFDSEQINKAAFPQFVAKSYQQADSFMHYLCEALELAY